jgi:transcriptional regulator with XRE-family HTH domain
MVSQLLKRLRNTNKKLHQGILQWLGDYEYRADVFVDEYLAQLSRKLEEDDISDSDLAEKAGVDKSAVSQFFDSNSNIKVKTLFKYADAAGFSLQSPKLLSFDVEEVYARYQKEELEADRY